jgi:hypothetical protein
MSNDELAGEVSALRAEIQALTQGLLLQQKMLRTMDEKLNRLLQAATIDDGGENSLQDLLGDIVKATNHLTKGQAEIIKLLHAPAPVQ